MAQTDGGTDATGMARRGAVRRLKALIARLAAPRPRDGLCPGLRALADGPGT
ncbi:MAG: hypothetical protein FWC46_09510 [Actinomycetia bacterium]|nr:hypothetical protein [Actinomycetes bacterium]